MLSILAVLATVSVGALLASAVMSRAADRSALFNMLVGGILAVLVLAAALAIAFFLTRVGF